MSWILKNHYDDVIMGTIASQITCLTSVYSTVYSGADQSKHQSSASLAFVWGIHRGPVNSPHKWPVTRKMFPFDDVIMMLTLILLLVYWQRSMGQSGRLAILWLIWHTQGPAQNGHHFADAIFGCISLNESRFILIRISLEFVLKAQISKVTTCTGSDLALKKHKPITVTKVWPSSLTPYAKS